MRHHSSTAMLVSLLLCACAVESGNEADNAAAPDRNATAPAPVEGGNQAPPARQPGNGADAPEAAEVTLSASPEQTTENSTVTLTLRNGSEEQVGYNLCTSDLQTAGGGKVPTNVVCTMELRTLEPGRTATYGYKLPVNMATGSYRFATQVHWTDSGRTDRIRSNIFEVRPD